MDESGIICGAILPDGAKLLPAAAPSWLLVSPIPSDWAKPALTEGEIHTSEDGELRDEIAGGEELIVIGGDAVRLSCSSMMCTSCGIVKSISSNILGSFLRSLRLITWVAVQTAGHLQLFSLVSVRYSARKCCPPK